MLQDKRKARSLRLWGLGWEGLQGIGNPTGNNTLGVKKGH
jgi:hypothetical protein